ncbi:formimidoylglutamase [Nonlabens ponticola]|uniref:Arginase n=1 Tax=Nonlabens ponticola TaxID=2496866 RepID=A0A3S9MU77_9FLAO|nr:formimidoylglutamase [Nonlabens ponticola]AZQ42728.1 arginase [Nonlabens ponticola]
MALEYLTPISDTAVAHAKMQDQQALGNNILLHSNQDGLPDLDQIDIAIIVVLENRNDLNAMSPLSSVDAVRTAFYELFPGNWPTRIVDLGNVLPGESVTDTYFVVQKITEFLIDQDIIPVIIGGSQDLMYPMYRSFDSIKSMINVVNVDNCFDLGNIEESITSRSYIGKMVANEPYNLFNYSNLGFQTYYNSQDEIDLLERMYFDAIRLGELDADIKLAEPILRDADLIGFDLKSVKAADLQNPNGEPNGFSSAQLCSLSRYSGLSDRLKAVGFFELFDGISLAGSKVIAQALWYFIEGYSYRSGEYPIDINRGFKKYKVPVDDQTLIFYESSKTGRWWIELPFISNLNNKLKQYTLLPCDKNDYLMAADQILPKRWLKARQKNEV